ncbi:thiol:disulfide interchange protein [Catenovulum maritimum]|uniref:Thiol:disulfide interchange protein n=2 Tax=Catenovulum maritimum TaxID=1513271 RepID=A0A0J8JH22_9ALTE|nr:thiol:disulfide interchange protein [Catenovulum maritimum]
MVLFKKALMLLVLPLVTIFALANSHQQLQQKLQNALEWQINSIVNSPIEGIYQLDTERGIFYASADGKYLMQARIYNVEAGMRDETEAALKAVRLNGVKRFVGDAIEFKADNEKYAVTVFTDLSCAYCQRMHEQMSEYNSIGITVRYLAFPSAGLSSQGFDDLISVWCAKDPKHAMTLAQAGKPIAANSCKNSIEEQFRFGQQIGINGTPNIILPDGSIIAGYQSASELLMTLTTPR